MCVAAFHLGLKNTLDELKQLIENDDVIYHKGYTASELRKLMIQNEIPQVFDKNDICKLTKDIVDLASGGLKKRGISEEKFLSPLYNCIKNHTNPGKDLINSLNNGVDIEELIKEYGWFIHLKHSSLMKHILLSIWLHHYHALLLF